MEEDSDGGSYVTTQASSRDSASLRHSLAELILRADRCLSPRAGDPPRSASWRSRLTTAAPHSSPLPPTCAHLPAVQVLDW